MLKDFERSIARIYCKNGEIIGAGFLASTKQVITCAHVVASSLGMEDIPVEAPVNLIRLDFPLADSVTNLTAKVLGWKPESDIALLEIVEELPSNVSIPPLFRSHQIANHEFHVYGFPDGVETGRWSFGRILGEIAGKKVQIESITAYTIRPGFSGSLVWDATDQKVLGIIVETDLNVRETKTAYFLPINLILEHFPDLENKNRPHSGCLRYAGFISYPNDSGQQGQLVREIANTINASLTPLLRAMLDVQNPIYFNKEHIESNEEIEKALCESACLIMVLTPKYFDKPLCAQEYTAMMDLETSRLFSTGQLPDDLSFIIPVRPFSPDILPMRAVGKRRDYDFRDAVMLGDLSKHPQYGPLVKDLAEHIFKCYKALEGCDDDPCCGCSEFKLPELDQIQDLVLSYVLPKRKQKLPTR